MSEMCFAWSKGVTGKWGCKALTSECNGMDEKCPFYKTREQQDAEKEESYKRIAKLPAWQRRAISDQYYRSESPWGKYIEGDDEQEVVKTEETALYEKKCAAPVKTKVVSGNIDDIWRKVYGDLQQVAGCL